MHNEFLKNLSHELNTQNNRCTASPLFCVQQKKRIYGMDSGYSEGCIYQWRDDPEYFWETEREALDGLKRDDLPEEDFDDYIEEIYYVEIWDFVTAHLTEKAAQRYIDENRHNLNEPRIYVTSQYRCDEFNKVVDYLKNK